MMKKFTLFMAAVAVFAVAVPAMAGASTGLTMPAGTFLPVGKTLEGVSVNAVTTTSIGNLKCEKVVVKGEVTLNNEKEGVKGKGLGEGTSTKCFYKETIPITVKEIKLNTLQSLVGEAGKGKAGLSFVAVLPELTCTYSATEAPGTYVSGSGKLTFTKAALKATPAACGTATLDGDFTLSTTPADGGGEIIIM